MQSWNFTGLGLLSFFFFFIAPLLGQTPLDFVEQLEEAHQAKKFYQQPAIAFDLELFFGGKERLVATITSKTNSTAIRLEKADGTTLIYDGTAVYQTRADTTYPRARFDIFTWQYFFMAPFKFSDPGTQWELMGEGTMKGATYDCAKLTFKSGTGDSPDDWYLVYKAPEKHILRAMAYIVTLGKTQEEAEKEPHAISYHQYEPIAGIPIATEWRFWMWYEEQGFGEQIGLANIRNVRFVDPEEDFFQAPKDAKAIKL